MAGGRVSVVAESKPLFHMMYRITPMNDIKRILLVLDSEKQQQFLLDQVAALARGADAQVTLLATAGELQVPLTVAMEAIELEELVTKHHTEQLESAAAILEKAGVRTAIKVAYGKPFMAIIREVIQNGFDIVVKAAEGQEGARRILFGGTDMQLLRMCPCPVWIVKPGSTDGIRSIMTAVDLVPHDEEKNRLATKILRWGGRLAALTGAKLHVLHAWQIYGEATMRRRMAPVAVLDKLAQDEQRRHRQLLEEALAKAGLDEKTVEIHFHKDDARELIPAVANKSQIDLLLMGTIGRTGIPGFFIGNTAESVLHAVNCSILAIKPDGFVSPVKLDDD